MEDGDTGTVGDGAGRRRNFLASLAYGDRSGLPNRPSDERADGLGNHLRPQHRTLVWCCDLVEARKFGADAQTDGSGPAATLFEKLLVENAVKTIRHYTTNGGSKIATAEKPCENSLFNQFVRGPPF
jgi:hypothetical protein